MQKSSFLFLIIIAGVALLGAGFAFGKLPPSMLLVQFTALAAFFILCISLIIGPLAVIDPKYASLIEPRRAAGLAAFVFVALHFILSLGLYFNWQAMELLNYFPIVVSIPALAILVALALTSCDYAVKKMGMGNWKTLQMLVYPAFVLIFAHFVLQASQHPNFSITELALLALGAATVLFQLYGFYLKRKRVASTKAGAPSP